MVPKQLIICYLGFPLRLALFFKVIWHETVYLNTKFHTTVL